MKMSSAALEEICAHLYEDFEPQLAFDVCQKSIKNTETKSGPKELKHQYDIYRYFSIESFLGLCYFRGYGTSCNKEIAFMYFQEALDDVDNDDIIALYYASICMECGFGTKQSLFKANKLRKRLFKVLSEVTEDDMSVHGIRYPSWAKGLFYLILGKCYLNNYGIEDQQNESFGLFHKSSSHGNTQGDYYVGSCIEENIGINTGIELAISWYCKAADHKNEDAIYALYRLYKNKALCAWIEAGGVVKEDDDDDGNDGEEIDKAEEMKFTEAAADELLNASILNDSSQFY